MLNVLYMSVCFFAIATPNQIHFCTSSCIHRVRHQSLYRRFVISPQSPPAFCLHQCRGLASYATILIRIACCTLQGRMESTNLFQQNLHTVIHPDLSLSSPTLPCFSSITTVPFSTFTPHSLS